MVRYMWSAISQKDSSFVHKIYALVNYAIKCELEYTEVFIDARSKHIDNDATSSGCVPSRSPTTFIRNIRLSMLIPKNNDAVHLVKWLSFYVGSEKNVGISYVDKLVLYSSEIDEIEYLIT